MKRAFVLCMFLYMAASLFAQEEEQAGKPFALGLGLEFNMNSRDNFAGGGAFSFDYSFANVFAAGVNFVASYNFDDITVLEPAAMFRWYFLSSDYTGFFAQADIGAYIVLEDDHTTPLFLGGLRAGYRLPVGKFFVEPFGRVGYPFMFGVGAIVGVRF